MPAIPDDNLTSYCAAFGALAARRAMRTFLRARSDLPRASAPGVVRHPVSAADTAVRNLRSLGRLMKPPAQSLSPIMVERRWSQFATLDVDLALLRKAAKGCGATVNDAFLAALGKRLRPLPREARRSGRGLQAAVAVNIRRPGDSPYGNHVSGGAFILQHTKTRRA